MAKRGSETGYEIPEGEEILYNPGYADEGEAAERDPLLVPGSGQDLSRREKTTLGNYLSSLTAGRAGTTTPNSFTVPGGSNDTGGSGHSVSLAVSTHQGPALSLVQMRSAGTTNGTFSDLTQGLNKDAIRRFEDIKNSDYGSGNNPFKDTEVKNFTGNTRRKGQDGNSLLSSVQGVGEGPTALGDPKVGPAPDTVPAVQKKISEVMRSNRFNPIDKAFVQDKSRTEAGYTIQRTLGKYDADSLKISEKKLSSVATNLLINATGITGGKQYTGGIPIIDTADLRAQSIVVVEKQSDNTSQIDNIAQGGKNPETRRETFLSPEYTLDMSPASSYGSMNSPLEPFSGMGPLSDAKHIATLSSAVISIYSLVKILDSKNLEFSTKFETPFQKLFKGGISVEASLSMENPLYTEGLGGTGPKDYSGRGGYELEMGSRKIKSISQEEDIGLIMDFAQKLLSMLKKAVPETEYSFADSILRGSDIILRDVMSDSSGYIASLARSVSRSTIISIENSISGLASSFTNLTNTDVFSVSGISQLTAGALTAYQQTWNLFETFFRSSVFRFVKDLAQMGDRKLISERIEAEKQANTTLPISPDLRIQASRISDFGADFKGDLGSKNYYALSWKHSSAPCEYILPVNFAKAVNDYSSIPGNKFDNGIDWGARTSNLRSINITEDAVKVIEDSLESEYVPFYFHDLRTNEVISFHAFLSDLSDGFTANYDSVSGYGRADDIMTYKSTKRSISFSFSVAATSVEDLDVMYWNINKLVTMLYPQYSRGRAMKSGDDKFIQPFSQIPTASPLIRVRIGDIIKGNYSKFAIARLFGLGESSDVFSPQPSEDGASEQPPGQTSETFPTENPTPPAPPLPDVGYAYRLDQIINIRPGTPSRFMDRAGNPFDEVRRNALSARRDAIAQNRQSRAEARANSYVDQGLIDAGIADTSVATATNANSSAPDVPIPPVPNALPQALRRIPPGTRAKVVQIALTKMGPSQTQYIVEIQKIPFRSIVAIAGNRTRLDHEWDWGSGAPRASDLPTLRTEEAVIRRTVTTDLTRRLGEYKYMALLESEIVQPRSRSNQGDADSATAANDTIDIINNPAQASVPSAPSTQRPMSLSQFLKTGENGNPVIRSFESTRGRGLAGFITDIKFDWNESTWETEPGKRAPKYMKVSVTFAPIHDIPLGMDTNGALRSVAYNVGALSKTVGNDPYDD